MSPQADIPSQYVVTDIGDPSKYADIYKGEPPPFVRYLRSDELELPNNEDLKRDSTVREVRQWSKASKVEADNEAFNLLLDLKKLPPVEVFTSTTTMGSTNINVDGGNRNQDVTEVETSKRQVETKPTASLRYLEGEFL